MKQLTPERAQDMLRRAAVLRQRLADPDFLLRHERLKQERNLERLRAAPDNTFNRQQLSIATRRLSPDEHARRRQQLEAELAAIDVAGAERELARWEALGQFLGGGDAG